MTIDNGQLTIIDDGRVRFWTASVKEYTPQRNRRERPVCRSGSVPDRTAPGLNGVPHDTVQKLPPVGKLARPWARLMRLPRGSVKHCGNNRRIRRNVVPMSFRPQRQRSGGIFPSSINNLRKVKLATWEDRSTSFHFGRDDMSGGGAIQPHGLYLLRGMAMNHRRYIGCTVVRSGCSGGRSLCKTFPHTCSVPVDKTRKLEYSIDTKGATSRSAPQSLV